MFIHNLCLILNETIHASCGDLLKDRSLPSKYLVAILYRTFAKSNPIYLLDYGSYSYQYLNNVLLTFDYRYDSTNAMQVLDKIPIRMDR